MNDEALQKIVHIANAVLAHRKLTEQLIREQDEMDPQEYACMMAHRSGYDYEQVRELKRIAMYEEVHEIKRIVMSLIE